MPGFRPKFMQIIPNGLTRTNLAKPQGLEDCPTAETLWRCAKAAAGSGSLGKMRSCGIACLRAPSLEIVPLVGHTVAALTAENDYDRPKSSAEAHADYRRIPEA